MRWIPTSKELPSPVHMDRCGGWVLVAYKPRKTGGECETFMARRAYDNFDDEISKDDYFWDVGEDTLPDDNVHAWMPLPEPYVANEQPSSELKGEG